MKREYQCPRCKAAEKEMKARGFRAPILCQFNKDGTFKAGYPGVYRCETIRSLYSVGVRHFGSVEHPTLGKEQLPFGMDIVEFGGVRIYSVFPPYILLYAYNNAARSAVYADVDAFLKLRSAESGAQLSARQLIAGSRQGQKWQRMAEQLFREMWKEESEKRSKKADATPVTEQDDNARAASRLSD